MATKKQQLAVTEAPAAPAPYKSAFFKKSDLAAIEALAVDFSDPDWFIQGFQVEDDTDDTALTSVRLGELVAAFQRSEALMKQFEVNTKAVYDIAKSLFVEGSQLHQPISVIELLDDETSTLYGYGGRHRTHAIVEFVKEALREDAELQAKVLNDTHVLVLLRKAGSIDTVKERIFTDNKSRNMTPAEHAHIKAQAEMGLKATGVTAADFARIMQNESLSKSERGTYLGLLFGRLMPKGAGLKPTTTLALGKKLIAFFDDVNDEGTQGISHTGAGYFAVAKDVWGILQEEVFPNYENIARSVNKIAEDLVDSATFNERVSDGTYIVKAATKKAAKATVKGQEPAAEVEVI